MSDKRLIDAFLLVSQTCRVVEARGEGSGTDKRTRGKARCRTPHSWAERISHALTSLTKDGEGGTDPTMSTTEEAPLVCVIPDQAGNSST